ncbi:nuclear transport factor 2 family protein [Chryseobacterium sp.]|jgi:ketosteroid isomerase-like protein|uniref:nuclear transport factor 2 family protein n=1 Tax=Chryseobacterium sp. TaxID=1871047 RepID=UPI0028423867|nr:nuclear transport factor 2 family protein [Chryseobacterium sp.]MDR3023488.1 nuclear transport factor 2 family protein [Chryseobacterium sp.]
MKLPKVVANLVEAQNNYDSVAYANCFSETATVFDENKIYKGRIEIQNWISDANKKYKTVKKPINFVTNATESILSVEVSGEFEGSPVVLYYHFKIAEGEIQSLKITI